MQYHHVQRGPWYHVLLGVGVVLLVAAWYDRANPVVPVVLSIAAVLTLVLSFALAQLTVQDEVDSLAIRFGPLPLFSKRIPYADVTAVEPGRTSFLDGWGIHYLPGRGWTYNVWGYDCVKLTLGKKVIRVGSDDVDNLIEFLRSRIGRPE